MPTEQAEQSCRLPPPLVARNVPAGQLLGAVAPLGQYWPPGQGAQSPGAVPKVVPRYVPAKQFKGAVLVVLLQNWPAGQARHTVWFALGW